DVVEHAGLVLEPRPEREVAARRHEPLLERLAEQVRVDVPAADDDADLLPADPAARLEDRGERGGARALGEELGPLEEHDDLSSASVPCPAMTSASSNACTYARRRSRAISSAAACASS